MNQSRSALRVPLNRDPHVEEVTDADAFDSPDCSIYQAPEDSIVDLIEEERCHRSPDGIHTYIQRNHCNYCGIAAPWVRRDACRS